MAGGNASLTTITTSVIGANEDSEGTVNVLGGTWRLYDSGNNARPLNVGQSGTGTLNIKQKGHVDGGYLRIGSSTGGVGTVNVEGEDSVLTTEFMLITGDDKDGKVIHDAGHTVFNAGNTYSGKTLVNDGLLTIASHTADGVTGMGSSEVTIANPGTLDILASTNSAGDYTLTNALKGDGLMRVQLSSSDKMFGFTHATGTEFAGVAQLKDSTKNLG
ncbi:TPA: hypothetical protein RM991_004212 [Escherichia coli]|nr:hypothetical protein [Escherichia coli]HDW8585882.1 hypothetical protein [Escherichia coli]HDW8590616.1 hypothetical protein [Escherichia coli]